MKRKILIILLAVIATLCMAFGLTACGETDQEGDLGGMEQGEQGEQGGEPNSDDDEQGSTTAPHVHSYSEWKVIKQATCKEAGTMRRSCTCGDVQFDDLPQKEHSFVDYVCEVCGAVEPGAVEVKVYIDDKYQKSLYTGVSNDYKIQLPEYLEDQPQYFDAWYPDTEYMEPLTGDETYKENAAIYARWIPLLNFKATVRDGEATIETCYSALETAVVVPYSYLGRPITGIADRAFKTMSKLRWLIICSPIRTIGQKAFMACWYMEKVVLPDSLTSIGEHAFDGCSSLEKIVLPNGLTSIGDYAFKDCEKLTEITIPDSVTSIGREAFEGTAYYKDEGNRTNDLLYIGNHLINAKNTISGSCSIREGTKTIADYAFYMLNGLTSVMIPDGVVSIGVNAFYDCVGLTSIDIPDTVISIGDYAFQDCRGLKDELKIPDSVTSIGSSAFYYCRGLTSVTIGSGVTSIGGGAFAYCSGLNSVTIGSGVTSIGGSAFSGCSGLTGDLKIPDSVTSIGWGVFFECSRLTSVTIGSGVTEIGDRAFFECSKLEAISVAAQNSKYSSQDGVLYDKAQTQIILVPTAIKEAVTIPNSVTSIGEKAFYGRRGLTSVTIGSGVTKIGYDAFNDCRGLTEIRYNGTIEAWEQIPKGIRWDDGTGDYTVYCTDGTITKDGVETKY